ncbi:MAG: type 4a pilus biogenesis protein PilO [Gemmatimonadota bacterium]
MASLGDQKMTPILLILVAGLIGYMGFTGTGVNAVGIHGVQETRDSVKQRQKTIDSLLAQTDTAKRLLAQGSIEDLRRRLDGYRSSLELMRRLVPDRNEVPNLLDDISTRAKIRGVSLSGVTPLAVEPGPAPFDTYKYQVSVLGHYDQIGEFLSDVATLQRIIVPINLTLTPANPLSAKALGDSSGSMLEAKFQIRTYVKTAADEGVAHGT